MEALTASPSPAAHFGRFGRAVPDHRLVARVRAGDERAFEAVFDRYHRPLLAFCRHMLGSREEAEDALQHVFVSAHRHLVSRDDVVELRPWLYAIARNRCLSVLRARRESVALDDIPEPSFEGLSVAHEVEQRQDLQEVLGDLARLPDEQRAALVLSELGALSHDEIAAVLGVRRDKVKALVFQARESLAAWRGARNADCREIREQLANLRGGALRRGPLRKHLETCEGCSDFRSEVRRQREAMALLLPVVPSIALKAKIVGAVTASSSALPAGVGSMGAAGSALSVGVTGGGASAGGLSALGGSFVAKSLVVAAVAGTAGGGYAVVESTTAPRVSAPVERIAPAAEEQLRKAKDAKSTPAARSGSAATPGSPAARDGKARDRPGRGSLVPADKAKGKGKSDKATPGVPGIPPVAADAPGQAKKDGAQAKPPQNGKPESAGRPESPGRSQSASGRDRAGPPAVAPPERGDPPARARPEESRVAPDIPAPNTPPASTNAAAPPAASSRPESAGPPAERGRPDTDE